MDVTPCLTLTDRPVTWAANADLPGAVRDLAWRAQTRLCARFRCLLAKGKRNTVVVVAIAREIAAFLWAIARVVEPRSVPSAAA